MVREQTDARPQFLAGCQRSSGERLKRFPLRGRTRCAVLIAPLHQGLEKMLVGPSAGKVTAAPCSQRLVQRLLEAIVRLLDIAILVGHASVVPGRLHPVVAHQGLIAFGPLFPLFLPQLAHRCTEVIGTMQLWHPTELPQRALQSFGQRLETFAEADGGRFDIGVGEDTVKEQMGKRLPSNGNREIAHVRKIGLSARAGLMHLGKDDLLLVSMQGAPLRDMAL